MTSDIIIVSTPYLPGYKITKTIGFTWGLIVRSRGLGRNITAGLRSIIGGESIVVLFGRFKGNLYGVPNLKAHALKLFRRKRNSCASPDFDGVLYCRKCHTYSLAYVLIYYNGIIMFYFLAVASEHNYD